MKTCKGIPIRSDRDRLEFMGFFFLSLSSERARTPWHFDTSRESACFLSSFFFYSFFLSLLSYLLLSSTRLNGLYFYSWQPLQKSSRALAHQSLKNSWKTLGEIAYSIIKGATWGGEQAASGGSEVGEGWRKRRRRRRRRSCGGALPRSVMFSRHCLGRF